MGSFQSGMIEKLESQYPRNLEYEKRKDTLERRDRVINFYLQYLKYWTILPIAKYMSHLSYIVAL